MLLIKLNAVADQAVLDKATELYHQAFLQSHT